MFSAHDAHRRLKPTGLGVMLPTLFCVIISCLCATVQAATDHGLALLPTGNVAGWGSNEFGQVQSGLPTVVAQPLALALPVKQFVALALGARHSLAIDVTGKVWSWGDNSSGQLGLGHTRAIKAAQIIEGLPQRARAVVAGTHSSAALLSDGSVWVWGANNRGQLGSGKTEVFTVESLPRRVAGLGSATDLAAGDDFVLALIQIPGTAKVALGQVWAWGGGNALPQLLANVPAARSIRAAGKMVMVRDAKGRYWGWNMDALAEPPRAGTRLVYDNMGVTTHPMLRTLVNALSVPTASAKELKRSTAQTPVLASGALKMTLSASVPDLPKAAAAPVLPTAVPSPVTPTVTAREVLLPTAAAPVSKTSPPTSVSIQGTVRLSDVPMAGVQASGEGAQCNGSDAQGHFVCKVPFGWTGRIGLRRSNYQFSPNTLSFQNVRADVGQQDFAASYDPR